MGKKGFLLIDCRKDAVILTPDEFKQCTELSELLAKYDVIADVRRNDTMKQLDACVREYLKGVWKDD